MIITELRKGQGNNPEKLKGFTNEEIVLSWMTEQFIDPYNPEEANAFDDFHIKAMDNLDEQEQLEIVRHIFNDCPQLLVTSKHKITKYKGEEVNFIGYSTNSIVQLAHETSILSLLEDVGLKDKYLQEDEKHTYLGCVLTWLLSFQGHGLSDFELCNVFGGSGFFNLDMLNLTQHNTEKVTPIMRIVHERDYDSLTYLISVVNNYKSGFVTVEEVESYLGIQLATGA
ncbi:hypothetical protein [Halobacillus litoralis]|uniref:Uncharacterized protein n=1 Tax=Halobacillus litoralis TaxID=45668 RepID=A0A410MJ93_9BACI|nr:hypothetical protein [Halobacillus litoralis]QAS54763.1 hypothetical protein HLI_21130 [Halobacillus litoralis]